MEQVTLLKLGHVVARYDISPSTAYRLMREEMFPLPVKLGGKTQRWRSDELDQWIKSLEHGLIEGAVGISQVQFVDIASILNDSSQEKPLTEQGTLLKLQNVQQVLNVSRSTIYRFIKAGKFPLPVKLGGKTQRWRADELQNWIRGLEHGLVDGFSGVRPQDKEVAK